MEHLSAYGATHAGCVRPDNEDRFCCDEGLGLFVVADGVGGYVGGEVAAEIAVDTLRAYAEGAVMVDAVGLHDAVLAADEAIQRVAQRRPEFAGMACVLTALHVGDGRAAVVHVGDTRLYVADAEGIRKVTCDHSLVGVWEDAGILSEAEAMRHPRRNEILRDVGSVDPWAGAGPGADAFEVDVTPGDTFLLCSDGLTDLVPQEVLDQTLRADGSTPRRSVDTLIDLALAAGGFDNVTAVVVQARAAVRSGHPVSAAGPSMTPTRRRY